MRVGERKKRANIIISLRLTIQNSHQNAIFIVLFSLGLIQLGCMDILLLYRKTEHALACHIRYVLYWKIGKKVFIFLSIFQTM